ncbi:hypothetical protein HK405_008607, partial [Cladochytrium tenue]
MAWRALPPDPWHGLVVCSFVPEAYLASTSAAVTAAAAAPTTSPVDAASPRSAPPVSPSSPIVPVNDPAAIAAASAAFALASARENLLELDLGDRVLLLEEFVDVAADDTPTSPIGHGDGGGHAAATATGISSVLPEVTLWFRGYLFAAAASLRDPPRLGVFPASHVHCAALAAYRAETLAKPAATIAVPPGPSPLLLDQRASVVAPSLSGSSAADTRVQGSRPSSHCSVPLPSLQQPPPPVVTSRPPLPPPVPPPLETAAGARMALADEIAAALREWASLMKLHLAAQNYALYVEVRDLFDQLFQGRRQLLSQTLAPEQAAKLRRLLIARLDHGNRIQKLDLVVRHPDRGALLGEQGSSVIKMFRAHLETGFKWSSSSSSAGAAGGGAGRSGGQSAGLLAPPPPSSAPSQGGLTFMSGQTSTSMAKERTDTSGAPRTYAMYFLLTACTAYICMPGEYAELSFFLFNRLESRVVSEEFLVVIDYSGTPRTAGDGQARLKTFFCDLSPRDFGEHSFLVCRIVRVGKMNSNDKDPPLRGAAAAAAANAANGVDPPPGYRRPFGCAVLELQEIWNATTRSAGGSPSVVDATAINEFPLRLYFPASEAFFPTLHELIMNRQSGVEASAKPDVIKIAAGVFPSNLVQPPPPAGGPGASSPVSSIDFTPRMGFPDVMLPSQDRNSLYVTLVAGEFSARTPAALTARNVQVSAQLRRSDGAFLDACMSRGLGLLESTYDSIVYYHSNAPRYMEPFSVNVAPGASLDGVHLFLTFRHCSSSDRAADRAPFAFAYLPLARAGGTVIQDGQHVLHLYRWDRRPPAPSAYLSFQAGPSTPPAAPSAAGLASASPDGGDPTGRALLLRDIMTVRTALCSTTLTQSAAIVNFVHWRLSVLSYRLPAEQVVRGLFAVPEVEL